MLSIVVIIIIKKLDEVNAIHIFYIYPIFTNWLICIFKVAAPALFTKKIMNEWGFRPLLCIYNEITLSYRYTGFEIRALAVWDRARYLSVTEAPYNIASLWVNGKETFCLFLGNLKARVGSTPRTTTFQAGSFNHCTRAPAFLTNRRRPKRSPLTGSSRPARQHAPAAELFRRWATYGYQVFLEPLGILNTKSNVNIENIRLQTLFWRLI